MLRMKNNTVSNNSNLANQNLTQKGERLEWFLKKLAIDAVNESNKDDFIQILKSNDIAKFVFFLNLYVPEFENKLNEFIGEKNDA